MNRYMVLALVAACGANGGDHGDGAGITGVASLTFNGTSQAMSAWLSTLTSTRNGFKSVGWQIGFSTDPPGNDCANADTGDGAISIYTNSPGPEFPTLPTTSITMTSDVPCMSQTATMPVATFQGSVTLASGTLTLTSSDSNELVGSMSGTTMSGTTVTGTFDAPLCAVLPATDVSASSDCN